MDAIALEQHELPSDAGKMISVTVVLTVAVRSGAEWVAHEERSEFMYDSTSKQFGSPQQGNFLAMFEPLIKVEKNGTARIVGSGKHKDTRYEFTIEGLSELRESREGTYVLASVRFERFPSNDRFNSEGTWITPSPNDLVQLRIPMTAN